MTGAGPRHEPGGTPVGGRFATGAKDETGTSLEAVTRTELLPQLNPAGVRAFWADPAHTDPDADTWLVDALGSGRITDADLSAAIQARNIGADDLQGWLDEGGSVQDSVEYELRIAGRYGAELALVLDPWAPGNYTGDDPGTVAHRCLWGHEEWDTYTGAVRARQLGAALDRAQRSAGVDLTGTAAQVHARALEAQFQAGVILQLAGAKEAAETILAAHPTAAFVDLHDDVEDDTSYWASRVVDADGRGVAHFGNFGTLTKHLVDHRLDPRTDTYLDDERFSCFVVDNTSSAVAARLDLRAAAAIDLTAIPR